MDFLTMILLVVVAVTVIGLLGFVIPAGLRKPFIEQEETLAPALPENLPAPVQRWLEASKMNASPGGNLAAWGLGKMTGPVLPLLGQLWLPLRWTLYLVPGQAFVWRTQITWWRRRFLSGGDRLYEGKGTFDMGANELEGEKLDASQFTPLWIYSLYLAPIQILQQPGLTWKDVSESSATLVVPFSGYQAPAEENETPNGDAADNVEATGEEPTTQLQPAERDFILEFDPQNGQLKNITTRRTTARQGDAQPYYATFSSVEKEYPDGSSGFTVRLPDGLDLGWDKNPYQRLRLAGLAHGVSGVEEEITRGIRVL